MSRKTSLLEDIIAMPWPVGVIAAVITFAIFQFLQYNPPDGIAGQIVISFSKVFGWVLPGIFLLGSFFSFLTQIIRSKRFKNTKGIAEIRSLSWKQFESFIGELFREQGYFIEICAKVNRANIKAGKAKDLVRTWLTENRPDLI